MYLGYKREEEKREEEKRKEESVLNKLALLNSGLMSF